MQAVAMSEFGGPGVLHEVVQPDPVVESGHVIVAVEAVSVTRLDVFARAGNLPFIKLPHILGGEHAGLITEVGFGVSDLTPGERVAVFPVIACGRCRYCHSGRSDTCPDRELIGLHRQGAYAQYTCVPRENVRHISTDLSAVDAAALTTSGSLAWHQFRVADVRQDNWLLVQAAGGGLGSVTAALGVYKQARVIATSRSPEKRSMLESLGVEAALDATSPDFVDQVHDLTNGEGVQVAIDNVGDPTLFASSLAVLGRAGVLVLSGAGQLDLPNDGTGHPLSGPTLDLHKLYSLGQRVVGVTTADLTSFQELWSIVDHGFRAPVDRVFPLAEAEQAHAYVDANNNFGRVVLEPQSPDLANRGV